MRLKAKYLKITNVATNTALTAVENKILNVSNLVRKTDYDTKVSEIEKKITDDDHDKYITSPEFNKLTAECFATRLKQANLANKNDVTNFVNKANFDNKLLSFNERINSNKTKHVLAENELNELSKKVEAISAKGLTKDLINGYKVLNRASYFSSGTLQNYLIFFIK